MRWWRAGKRNGGSYSAVDVQHRRAVDFVFSRRNNSPDSRDGKNSPACICLRNVHSAGIKCAVGIRRTCCVVGYNARTKDEKINNARFHAEH